MSNSALGLIETFGYIPAVEAADVSLKAADIKLTGFEKVRSGIVALEIRGDVSAVQAALDAAEKSVIKVGELRSTHIIPRPSVEVEIIAGDFSSSKNNIEDSIDRKIITDNDEDNIKFKAIKKELSEMKVIELRSLARSIENIDLNKKEINYARKDKLLNAIAKAKNKK